jgi:quercetin dioxygenase-like cupin family protein
MEDFPSFMKNPVNRIAASDQATPGAEGFVFDGADGSQMAFWTCRETAISAPHTHDYDEWMLVVRGRYTLIMNGERVVLNGGDEVHIPRATAHAGEVLGGTRTIHVFGGRRAERESR